MCTCVVCNCVYGQSVFNVCESEKFVSLFVKLWYTANTFMWRVWLKRHTHSIITLVSCREPNTHNSTLNMEESKPLVLGTVHYGRVTLVAVHHALHRYWRHSYTHKSLQKRTDHVWSFSRYIPSHTFCAAGQVSVKWCLFPRFPLVCWCLRLSPGWKGRVRKVVGSAHVDWTSHHHLMQQLSLLINRK